MKTITLTIALLTCSQLLFAQTGSWNKAGNSLTGTEKIGSTNNKPIKFITNNTPRMTIDESGRVGVGITAAQAKFHVANGSSGTQPLVSATMVTESSSDNILNMLAPRNNMSGILFRAHFNPISGGLIFNNPEAPNSLQFLTSGATRMTMTATGLGIGTIAPKTKMHVFNGSAGDVAPHPNAALVVESSKTNFINLLNPSGSTSGVLFGNAFNNSDGGIIFSGEGTPRGLQFNTGNNVTRMVLTSGGQLGLKTKTPKVEMHVVHEDGGGSGGINHGLRIQNGINGHHWTFYVNATNGELDLLRDNKTAGYFSPSTGAYIPVLEFNSLKNVENAPDVLPRLMQLKVKQYHLAESKPDDKKQYGLLNQEAAPILPEVISRTAEDRYLVNQSAYGVIAIKAIQEQQQTIEKQQSEIAEMKALIQALQARIDQKVPGNVPTKEETGTGARLLQNAPNPFNTETSIHYYLPEIKENATLDILSSEGQVIKTYPIMQKGNGQVIIKSGELTAGTYYYILKLNGEKVDTKRMVLVK